MVEVAVFVLVVPHISGASGMMIDLLAHLFIGVEGNHLRQAKAARRAIVTDLIEARATATRPKSCSIGADARRRPRFERRAIVDYGAGNLHSALKALERAAREGGSDATILLTSDPDVVAKADRIVLPGVGAFADCRRGLDGVPGLVEALNEAVRVKAKPFLGICVGMQLLASRGLEKEVCAGLDWIDGDVGPIEPNDPALKIPHMGWNTLDVVHPHPVLADIPTGPDGWHAYFVHSYGFRPASPDDLVASTEYGGAIPAVVARDTIVGTQFHPEKSQALGLALLANFLRWSP